MSDLRRRQEAATRENEQRTRRVDAEDGAKRAKAARELAAKIAAAHAGARTKQEQVSARRMNLPSNSRGRGR